MSPLQLNLLPVSHEPPCLTPILPLSLNSLISLFDFSVNFTNGPPPSSPMLKNGDETGSHEDCDSTTTGIISVVVRSLYRIQ